MKWLKFLLALFPAIVALIQAIADAIDDPDPIPPHDAIERVRVE
jgi:hypothetical protein